MPMIAMAKALLNLRDANQQELIDAIRTVSKSLRYGMALDELAIQNFIETGVFLLELPKVEQIDHNRLEQLQRAALAALIAA